MPIPTRRPKHTGLLLALASVVAITPTAIPCRAQEPTRTPEPAPTAPTKSATDEPTTPNEWVPLESRILDCVPYVKAKMGDTEAWFMFDSGADTCFDDTWARAHIADITTDPPEKAELVGRTRVRRATVVVGGDSFEVKDSVCSNLRPFAESFKDSFAGLIGADFMATRMCRIRYSDGPLGPAGVGIARVDRPSLPPGTVLLPLLDTEVRPYITALAWQGSAAPLGVTVIVDTGMLGSALIGARCAERMNVLPDPGPATIRIGAYGPIKGRETQNITLDFGALQARELDAFIETERSREEVLIGGRILMFYQVVLDFPHRTIALTPDPPNRGLGFSIGIIFTTLPSDIAVLVGLPLSPPTPADSSSSVPNPGNIYFSDVTWGSPIFLAGVRTGDLLQAINGFDVDDLGFRKTGEFLGAARASGGEFTMTIRRGERTIEIRVPQREPYKDPSPSQEK